MYSEKSEKVPFTDERSSPMDEKMYVPTVLLCKLLEAHFDQNMCLLEMFNLCSVYICLKLILLLVLIPSINLVSFCLEYLYFDTLHQNRHLLQ